MAKGKICWLAGFFAAAVLLGGCAPGEDLYTATGSSCEGLAPVEMQMAEPLEFPYVLREASLVVLGLVSYEGPLDQGYAQDVAALLVSNPLQRPVEHALISLRQGERTLVFELFHLPAGGRILVAERSAQAYLPGPVQGCSCPELTQMALPQQLTVETHDGGITVRNNSKSACSATVYYKSYYPERDLLLGGESRSVAVLQLAAGESRRICLADFSAERTRIVAIETE